MYSTHIVLLFAIATLLLPHPHSGRERVIGHPQKIEAGTASTTTPHHVTSEALKDRVTRLYDVLPLTFEINQGQAASRAKYLTRSPGCSIELSSTAAWFNLRTRADGTIQGTTSRSSNTAVESCTLRMNLVGARDSNRVTPLDELPGKSNYFVGNDPQKWRTDIPNYSRIKFHNVYPGVDLLYYGSGRELEYDFVLAPGASFKQIQIRFEGAQRLTLDESGDLLIQTPLGEVRQRKPVTYQEVAGVKRPVEGSYVIRGTLEAGFEVSNYDPSLALVIDPVFIYSTSIGGSSNENGNAVATDDAGNVYITGATTSLDFPSVNAFQSGIKLPDVGIGIPSDVFIAKLNPSGTGLLYSTYLGGSRSDLGHSIAVDSSGNAYVTGFALSNDFPTTSNAFQTKASGSGDAFITKLNAGGNRLSYSTYLGGPNAHPFGLNTNSGLGIAVDREGSAYVTGYTFSDEFPLKRAAQGIFNSGNLNGFDCLRFFLAPTAEDAFITKLNREGSGLIYSTYLGGFGVDEANGIALDSSGAAYVVGTTCSFDFPGTVIGNEIGVAAFLTKISASGNSFVYSRRFGGRGQDFGNSVTVDANGNAYVTGQTDSDNFPTTAALQSGLAGSVIYITNDGGGSWGAASGLSNSPATSVAVDPSNPLRVLAGFINRFGSSGGLLESTDGGVSWGGSGYPNNYAQGVAIDPKNPSVIYTELYKSTNRGATWTLMRFPSGGPFGPSRLLIDPSNTSTVYLLSMGGLAGDVIFPPRFFKTTDAGSTWDFVRNGTNLFVPTSAVLDPQTPTTLYATANQLYKSTDAGATWRIPYEGNHIFSRLALDPINPSTLYLSDEKGSLFKSTDAGLTFSKLIDLGITVNDLQVDPITPTTVYAATGSSGRGGAVFKTTDGGQIWSVTDLIAAPINILAIDPQNPLTLIAGVDFDVDSFVVKANPTGTAFLFSTYLGTRSTDIATAIGVDGVGSAYVTGRTFSDRFPTKEPLQATKPSGLFDPAAFLTTLGPAGSAILFSSYVGGSDPSAASGIAVDPSGRVCVVGTTGSGQVVPTGVSIESVHGGLDAFVIKIASPPRITAVSVSGKNLIVNGVGFDAGAVILVDGAEQRTKHDQTQPATMLMGKKTAKNINPGQQVSVQVRNSDGLVSQPFSFVR
jgi:photosystem II stability/assembly factor-like uncharacterized protein